MRLKSQLFDCILSPNFKRDLFLNQSPNLNRNRYSRNNIITNRILIRNIKTNTNFNLYENNKLFLNACLNQNNNYSLYIHRQFSNLTNNRNFESYFQRYQDSIKQPLKFWREEASQYYWQKPFSTTQGDKELFFSHVTENLPWFIRGKTNVAYNCIDRHILNGKGDCIALRWIDLDFNVSDEAKQLNEHQEQQIDQKGLNPKSSINQSKEKKSFIKDSHLKRKQNVDKENIGKRSLPPVKELTGSLTYNQLRNEVNKMVNILRSSGVRKGDTVTIFLPDIPLKVITILSIMQLGAIINLVPHIETSELLADRILHAHSHIIISTDFTIQSNNFINIKRKVDDAIALCQEKEGWDIQCTLLFKRKNNGGTSSKFDIDLNSLLERASQLAVTEWMDPSDTLSLVFPKNIQNYCLTHTVGGVLVGAGSTLKYIFNNQNNNNDKIQLLTLGANNLLSYIGPLLNDKCLFLIENPNLSALKNCINTFSIEQILTSSNNLNDLFDIIDLKSSIQIQCLDFNLDQESREDILAKYNYSNLGVLSFIEESISPIFWAINSNLYPFYGVLPDIIHQRLKNENSKGKLCFQTPWPSLSVKVFDNSQKLFLKDYFITDHPIRYVSNRLASHKRIAQNSSYQNDYWSLD